MEGVAVLERGVGEGEAEVDLLVDRHHRADAVVLHADADHHHPGRHRHRVDDLLDHAGHADALEDDRPARLGPQRGGGAVDRLPRQRQPPQLLHPPERHLERVGGAGQVAALVEALIRGVDRGVDDDVGAAAPRQVPPRRREVGGDDAAHPARLQHADHRQPDRPAADHDRDRALADLAAADRVPADRHRLGQRRQLRPQPVRHREGKRLLDHDLLGVGAGGVGGEAGEVDIAVVAAHERDRANRRPGLDPLPRLRPVVDDDAAELVAEDDLLVRAHHPRVAELADHVGDLVGVPAGVEVGAADAAAGDVDQQLALARPRRLALDDRELGVFADDGFHRTGRRAFPSGN